MGDGYNKMNTDMDIHECVVCNKCGEEKRIKEFSLYKNRKGIYLRRKGCKACRSKIHSNYMKLANGQAEKKKKRDSEWRKENPAKTTLYRVRQKKNMKRFTDARRENLTDEYILGILKIKVKEKCHPDLIEAKRLQIKIQRLLEEKGHERHNRTAGRFS